MRGNARAHRFTVFDVMEAQGVFDVNPANTSSPDYRGPLPYPKMFYHPQGKTRVIQKAEIIGTPMGPIKVGEQTELISRIANDADEEAALRAMGWHDHPARAIGASGAEMPPMVAHGREQDLEDEIQRLTRELAEARAASKPTPVMDDAA
jgi:hypothetical protein